MKIEMHFQKVYQANKKIDKIGFRGLRLVTKILN
jgi:hypothetical protein